MNDQSALLDHFAPLGDDLTWTESSWFSWAIPDRDIAGLVWTHFRPNQASFCGGPAMWDRSGQHVWEFRYFDFQLMRPLPEGRWGEDYDKYDYQTPWGLDVRMEQPLQRYRIRYDRAGFRLDLTFTAIAPPNIMGQGFQDKPPMQQLGRAFKVHFEQPGRIAGWVELDGERLAVDCFSIRDGGHGPRSMERAAPGGYAWSTADARTGWHILAPDTKSRVGKAVGGYILRDGVISEVVSGHRRVLERDGPRPTKIEVHLKDALDRELTALGREQTPAKFMLFPDRGQWWTLYKWDYDGFTDATGEDQEYYGIHAFRDWHRAGPAVWERE
ncbi:MAG: hypothetical protein KGN34_00260 [Sphingomonadales bacterium]|nr:hypothetical protein [Sphingomonadales bacterium]